MSYTREVQNGRERARIVVYDSHSVNEPRHMFQYCRNSGKLDCAVFPDAVCATKRRRIFEMYPVTKHQVADLPLGTGRLDMYKAIFGQVGRDEQKQSAISSRRGHIDLFR